MDLTEQDRTDRISSVWVRDGDQTRSLALALGTMGVVGMAVALLTLRLAVRHDDAILLVLGARRGRLVAISAVRGGLIALGATAVGAGVAIVATVFGLHTYNVRGRFGDRVASAPIDWTMPSAVLLGLVALPAIAAAIGGVLGLLVTADARPAPTDHQR